MCRSSSSSGRSLKNASARPSGQRLIWSSVKPWNRTAAASSRSRAPMQPAHGDVVDHPLELVPIDERDPPGLLDGREQALVLEGERRRPAPGTVNQVSPAPWRIDPAVRGRRGRRRGCRGRSPRSMAIAAIIRAKSGLRGEVGPDGDGAVAQAQPAVGDEHRRVGPVLDAQALADRAPAERAVEREVVRRQLLEAPPASVADPMLAVAVDGPASPRRPRRRRGRCAPRPCPGRAPTRSSRPAATGSTGGRRRGRRRPRSGACGGGSASAACPG